MWHRVVRQDIDLNKIKDGPFLDCIQLQNRKHLLNINLVIQLASVLDH